MRPNRGTTIEKDVQVFSLRCLTHFYCGYFAGTGNKLGRWRQDRFICCCKSPVFVLGDLPCGETYITHHANEHAGLLTKERDENSQRSLADFALGPWPLLFKE